MSRRGGRVGFFLQTGAFVGDYDALSAWGVGLLESPRREPYGTAADITDPRGASGDLIQPTGAADARA